MFQSNGIFNNVPKSSAPVPVLGNGTVVNVEAVMQQIANSLSGVGVQLTMMNERVGRLEDGQRVASTTQAAKGSEYGKSSAGRKGEGKGKSASRDDNQSPDHRERKRASSALPPPPPPATGSRVRSAPY